MRVAALQHDICWEDPEATCARLRPRIADAKKDGAGLVLLTEMFATGFSLDADRVAEEEGGLVSSFLSTEATTHGVFVGGSVAVRPTAGGLARNRFVLAGPDGTTWEYDKIHPFTYGGEHRSYSPGTRRLTVEVDDVRLTPFVCYDLRFADWFWDAATTTDCYAVVANWPAVRQEHWRALLVARAIENQAYVVGVNRVGTGGGIVYAGGSLVVSPSGEVLAEAANGEETLIADLDPARVAAVRAEFPVLADR